MKGYDIKTGKIDLTKYDGNDLDRLLERLSNTRDRRGKRKKKEKEKKSENKCNKDDSETYITTEGKEKRGRIVSKRRYQTLASIRYRLPFGPHRGLPLVAVPHEYLTTLVRTEGIFPYLVSLIGEELDRRGRLER